MSSNSVDVNDLAEAVGEDPDLTPDQKETIMRFAKDGESDENAPEFEYDVAHIHTAEAGLCRRWLKNEHFTLTEIRVNDSQGDGRTIEPDNFSGGRITAVWGYLPIATLLGGKSPRKNSNHSDVAPFQQSPSSSQQSSSPSQQSTSSSNSITEKPITAGPISEDTGSDDPDDVSDYKVTDPLDW